MYTSQHGTDEKTRHIFLRAKTKQNCRPMIRANNCQNRQFFCCFGFEQKCVVFLPRGRQIKYMHWGGFCHGSLHFFTVASIESIIHFAFTVLDSTNIAQLLSNMWNNNQQCLRQSNCIRSNRRRNDKVPQRKLYTIVYASHSVISVLRTIVSHNLLWL